MIAPAPGIETPRLSAAEQRAANAHVIRECLVWLLQPAHFDWKEEKDRRRVLELKHRHGLWERGR